MALPLRMFLKQHEKAIGYTIFTGLVFMLGWQTGRIMSPYYASSPIIFEDSVVHGASGPSPSLESLMASPEATQVSTLQSGSAKGIYVASRNSTLFHHYSCPSANSIKPENQIWYPSYDAAIAAGRTPSSCTAKLPKQ